MDRNIKALTFDVGGSVFDWQTAVTTKLSELAGQHGADIDTQQFAHAWRRNMFMALADVRKGKRAHANADQLHREGLDQLVPDYAGFNLSDSEKDDLTATWHHMDVWPDFPDALEALRKEYKVVILSALSYAILVDSSKHAGISWDGILSCEFLEQYKPEAAAYQQGARLLGLDPAACMMVAVHPPDLRAAQKAGFATAFVQPKLMEDGSAGSTDGFDILATDYADLVRQLTEG